MSKWDQLPGPTGPIQYHRDALGYPTIRARNLAEGNYALGYLHALDRLTQVTFCELAARGKLMATLGDRPITRLIDRSTRTIGLTRDLAEQVAACDPESVQLIEAYSRGFNAGAAARGRPWLLRILGVEPFVASPENVLAVFQFVTYFSLTSIQVCAELIVSELAARGAPERVFRRLLGRKARGLELEGVRQLKIPKEYSFFSGTAGSGQAGSNAFAVSGARSASGGALLVGEFHMEIGRFPPPVYAAHLAFEDGAYISGITIPGLNWFAAGRTRHVGWSYTFAHADNVDFLVERVKDGEYLAAGEYRPLRKRVERVDLKWRPSEDWVFWENDYGVLLGDAGGPVEQERVCLRVSGLNQAHRAFSAARRLLDCRSIDDWVQIQREVKSVSLEAIVVDHKGRIGSVVTGQIDQRPEGWTGAYPRSGWDLSSRAPQPLDEGKRPWVSDPPEGVIASANQGGHGPWREQWCSFPEPLYRFERINQRLAEVPIHDLMSLLRISYDGFDGSARRLLPVWKRLLPEHPLAGKLVDWANAQGDEALLRLFLRLHEEVTFRLLEQDLGAADSRCFGEWSALCFFQPQLDSLLALEQPELLDQETLQGLLHGAFFAALESSSSHEVPVYLRFKHPVTQGKAPVWSGFDSSEVKLPGTPVSPFQCRVSPVSGERLVYAPAFHLCFDMSDDRVFYNLPGGASESRWGPGYGRGVSQWLEGTLLPLGSDAPKLDLRKMPGN